jgi:predicted TIM-barrel fold metal-dependent hydrolase
MPIGVHVGLAHPEMVNLLSQEHRGGGFWPFRLSTIGAFHSLVNSEVPAQFPTVRFGFIEAAGEWVPYVVKHLRRRFAQRGQEIPDNFLASYNLYVSVQLDDNLQYLFDFAGDDHFVVGTDYGHVDPSTELDVFKQLECHPDVGAERYQRLVDANPRRFYAL